MREHWWSIRLNGGLFAASSGIAYGCAFGLFTYISNPLQDWRMLWWAESAVMALFAAAITGTLVTIGFEVCRRTFRSLMTLKENTSLAVMFGLAVGALALPTIDTLQGNVQLALPAIFSYMMLKHHIALLLFTAIESILVLLAMANFLVLAARYLGTYRRQ